MFHFKIDARSLPDAEFYELCARLQYVIEEENKKFKALTG